MPARMLRTYLKVQWLVTVSVNTQVQFPIVAVSVELYDDATNTRHEKPVSGFSTLALSYLVNRKYGNG